MIQNQVSERRYSLFMNSSELWFIFAAKKNTSNYDVIACIFNYTIQYSNIVFSWNMQIVSLSSFTFFFEEYTLLLIETAMELAFKME